MLKKLPFIIVILSSILSLLACKGITPTENFHYVAIGEVPESTMVEVANTLEENRLRIVENFGVKDLPIITVKIWQDREPFEIAYGEDAENTQGYVDIENWEVRFFNGRPTLGLSAVHEFTHLVTVGLNPTIANNPRWLWEATAIYESNRPPVPNPTTLTCLSPSTFPSLDELNTHPFNIYRMGYFITEYIVANWEQEDLNKLIESNGDIQESLGLTEELFEQGLLEFMLSEYDIQYNEDASTEC